ncbi:HAMP domain-containing sensor histidine kinase [Cohnella sp. REN36]|uniref:sensor histidine kinase n=1 Tax=Cohnella sp. REN36 TaxID=2887347 RepID=UPI001D13FA31|nr:HAMP domain-containing sensor histidine kinase [Cohnella sp. REN36]MCC3377215.1 HAMP domain-containing histidine kinase [Cohnella sp. REN36]
MSYVKDILLQLLFALTPFVLYNIYYRDKAIHFSKPFIVITCMICLLLSMTFPLSVEDGIIFDIRYVIMFFGLVFGGMTAGMILLLEFMAYRLSLGGAGLFSALIILSITFPLSLLLSFLYRRYSKWRMLIVLIAGLLFSVIPIGVMLVTERRYVMDNLTFNILAMPVQNSLGIWLLFTLFHKAVSDKQLYLDYLRIEKVDTINHVAASLAHEVRNPLTAVSGFLKLMRNEALSPEKTRQFIDICMEEIKRTELILSEYLSISKPGKRQYEPVDLSELSNAIVEIMTPYANMNNVHLSPFENGPDIRVSANPNEIKQLLINFLKNAIEACSSVSNGQVSIRVSREAHHAKIAILDNGIGMSKEQVDRLGIIYFSTKNKGTGVGLTYSYQLIRSMNGEVSVRSEPGKGTEFLISLPLLPAQSPPDAMRSITG